MIDRFKDILTRHVVIPAYSPVHRRRLRHRRRETFVVVDAMANQSRRAERSPLVLVGLHQHLGDVVMASAVVRELRRRHPDAALCFATQRRFRSLVAYNPRIDHVIDCDCVGSLVDLARHPAFDRRYLLVLHGNHCELCGGSYQDPYAPFVASGIDASGWFLHGRHLVDLMFERLGWNGADATPELHVPAQISADMRRLRRRLVLSPAVPVVAMHMTTPHWPAKQWPRAKFSALIERVTRDLDAQVIVVGGERVAALPREAIDLTRRTTLLETAALLAEVDLFVGVDSGPSHLAAAVGTPSVLLFGPTDPAACRPRGRQVVSLWHGWDEDGPFIRGLRPGTSVNRDIAKITVDEAFDAVRALLRTAQRAPAVEVA